MLQRLGAQQAKVTTWRAGAFWPETMRSCDVFRPRLPIDPFHDAQTPWAVDPDAESEPHTVLVLGAPTAADLAPLVLSPRLAATLVLVATHTPPPVPDAAQCPVVILRLPAPLDIHDAGAVRLVGLLDRAQRVAHTWHAAPHAQPRIQQLAELYPGGEFSIAEPPEFALPADPQHATPEPRSDSSETSSLSSSSSSCAPRQPAPPKGQYTFSALVNFLPPTLPDKALLKHAILVTTLSAPFLAPQPPALPYTKRQSIFSSLSLSSTRRRRSRFASLFSKQPPPASTPSSLFTSSTDSLAARPARHAHIVHVLPYAAPHPHRSSTAPTPSALNPARRSTPTPAALLSPRSKLAQSIEQFLLSFAYPPSASASAPSLASLSANSGAGAPPPHRAAPARSSPLASPAGSLRTVHTAPRRAPTPTPAPLAASASASASSSASPSCAPSVPPAVPYLLPAGLLGACPPGSTRCIGEMVLCGLLDRVAAGASAGAAESGCSGAGAGAVEGAGGWPRAWIGGRTEVVVPGAPMSQSAGVGAGAGASAPSSPVGSAFGDRAESPVLPAPAFAAPSQSQSQSDSDSNPNPSPPHPHPHPRPKRNSTLGATAAADTSPNPNPSPTATANLTPNQNATATATAAPKRKKRHTRRNEAGLPTPPESSSSSDDDDGGSAASVAASASASVARRTSVSASDEADNDKAASAASDHDKVTKVEENDNTNDKDKDKDTDADNDNEDAASVYGGSADADADADGTEDTHASHLSRASAPAGTRSAGLARFSRRWRGKTRSEAHAHAPGCVGGGGDAIGERGEGQKGLESGRGRVGEKVYRIFGGGFGSGFGFGFGRLVRGVRGRVGGGGVERE
ncbi:hypothetical protein C0993_010327 [Termitomyces sp. T159_Od127]|nr:hypothetical protein C0993_010327 [Termitomyces sp. T159_Od127]